MNHTALWGLHPNSDDPRSIDRGERDVLKQRYPVLASHSGPIEARPLTRKEDKDEATNAAAVAAVVNCSSCSSASRAKVRPEGSLAWIPGRVRLGSLGIPRREESEKSGRVNLIMILFYTGKCILP